MKTNTKFSISEKFYTIQGEGPNVGEPCVFIRLNYCHLNCPFCDSKYSVYEDLYKNDPNYEEFSSENMYELIDFIKNKCKSDKVVITGGEPLSDIFHEPLTYFVELLKKNNIKITFETTLLSRTCDIRSYNVLEKLESFRIIFGLEEYDKRVLFSCSPKIDTKCYDREYNIKYDEIINFYSLRNKNYIFDKYNFYYKFVYYKNVSDSIYDFCSNHIPDSFKNRIFVMPLTPFKLDSDIYSRTCNETVQFCMDNNLRYSPRIHIDLWGLKRGV